MSEQLQALLDKVNELADRQLITEIHMTQCMAVIDESLSDDQKTEIALVMTSYLKTLTGAGSTCLTELHEMQDALKEAVRREAGTEH